MSESERRLLLKQSYSEKIQNLASADNVKDRDFYELFRRFFADFLKLDYEFAYEELSLELNKIYIKPALKKDIDQMIRLLTDKEYLEQNPLTLPEIKILLNNLLEIVNSLIIDVTEKKESFLDKIFRKKSIPEVSSPLNKDEPVPLDITSSDINLGLQDKPAKTVLPVTEVITTRIVSKSKIPPELTADKVIEPQIQSNKADSSELDSLLAQINSGGNVLLVDEKKKEAMRAKTPASKKPEPDVAQNRVVNIPNTTAMNIPNNLIKESSGPQIQAVLVQVEQSYNKINEKNIDSAIVHYKNAISLYNPLDYDQKTSIYLELYDLYLRLIQL